MGLWGTLMRGRVASEARASLMIDVRASDSAVAVKVPMAATASVSEGKRSPGSLASMRVTHASSSSGTSGRASRTGGTGSRRCPRMTSPSEGPS